MVAEIGILFNMRIIFFELGIGCWVLDVVYWVPKILSTVEEIEIRKKM